MHHGRPRALLLLVALLAVSAAGIAASPAYAETIRLRDGTVLEAESIEFLDGRIRLRIVRDDAATPVEFAFSRFTPRTVLKLYDRSTDTTDARQRLRGARIAIELGLPKEARKRFQDAQRLDPALKSEVEQGLDEIRFAEATRAFLQLEERLRKGKDPVKALAALEQLVVGPHALYLSVAQLKRIEVLTKLARQLAERDAARKAKKDKKRKPKPGKEPRRGRKPRDRKPPPKRDTEASPYAPGSYADKRWRERHGPRRPAPPVVPGRERPPLQGERGQPGGGNPGSPRGGQSDAKPRGSGVRGGQGKASPPSGSRGGGQGSGLER